MKAMVAALRKHPSLNSSLDEAAGEIVVKHYFNIGLSIQTEDGLTAPVVKDVDRKSVLELAREIRTSSPGRVQKSWCSKIFTAARSL